MSAPARPARIAIVTGGARGIGAAIATRLAEDGCDIAILDLTVDAAGDVLGAVEQVGRRAIALRCNVADEAEVRDAVVAATDRLGPPTILVNNAGILRDRSVAKMTLDEWETVIAVNLRSAFLMCREVQPHMRAARWGRIVNLSSIAALGALGEANYAAAKAGIQGLTRTLAIELGRHGITANAVAPGFVITEMTREVARINGVSIDDLAQNALQSIHVGRCGTPEDIANAAAFFADVRSGFVTGQVLYVAGAPRG